MAHSALYIRIMNSARWRKLRNDVISEQPVCQECQKHGIVRASRCVHHIVPIESQPTEALAIETAFRRSNLVALCFECHKDIHAAERSHSKANHKQRTQDALQRWIDKHKPKQ